MAKITNELAQVFDDFGNKVSATLKKRKMAVTLAFERETVIISPDLSSGRTCCFIKTVLSNAYLADPTKARIRLFQRLFHTVNSALKDKTVSEQEVQIAFNAALDIHDVDTEIRKAMAMVPNSNNAIKNLFADIAENSCTPTPLEMQQNEAKIMVNVYPSISVVQIKPLGL